LAKTIPLGPRPARGPSLHHDLPRIEVIDKLHFEIVRGCQLRCVGCPNSTLQPQVKRIAVEDFHFLLGRIDVQRVDYLRLFSYGEPLLHRDLAGILECIPRQRWTTKRVEISTNAQFADWTDLEAGLRTRILSHISVSCDGDGTPEDYERLRPPSRWSKLIEFLERCRELRDRYCPQMELMTRTVCTDPKAQERWRAVLEPRGWIPEFRDWLYLPESQQNMTGREIKATNRVCSFQAVDNRLYVDWDGTVVPCCAHPRAAVLGNLRENTYNEIMYSLARAHLLQSLLQRRTFMPICGTCEF
jgi:radical SAM protein with 4Fe4S-binding SPASM domain